MSTALKQVRGNRESCGTIGRASKKIRPRGKRKTITGLAVAPSPALMGLPRIPAGVPSQFILPVHSQRSAKIALTMLDAGLLSDADIVDGDRHPVTLVENAFNRWFDRIVAPLSIFDLNLNLTDSVDNWQAGFDNDDANRELGMGESETISIAASFGRRNWFMLKDKVEAIEKIAPGLGRTAIVKLESVLYSSMFVITPSFIEDAARYQYWGGCENEDEYLGECCMDCSEEEIETMKENMVTLADVMRLLPPLETEALELEAIRDIATSGDPLVASVAALLLEKDSDDDYQRPTHVDQVSNDGTVCTEPGVWLQWQEDDLAYRIVDDWYMHAMECGATEISVFWMCEIATEKIVACFKNIERYVARLVWAEQLLSLIGTVETT